MQDIPAFLADKNKVEGKRHFYLVEICYDEGPPASYLRLAQWTSDVTFEGETWTAFPFARGEMEENANGELPSFDLTIANAGKELVGIIELYEVEGLPGRILTVHPDMLTDDTAVLEEPFYIVSCKVEYRAATITVSPIRFDPLRMKIPSQVVTKREFPGLLGTRRRYLI